MIDRVQLRDVQESDLELFFEQQRDPLSNQMAAMQARDQETFTTHWEKIMQDENIFLQTILFEGLAVGHLVSFIREGQREVGYWLGREFWGKGIVSRALAIFLGQIEERPLYAHVAKHNLASYRVLEKCGFRLLGEEKDFALVQGKAVDGLILMLDH